jgi:hypothetical protein
MCHFYKTLNQQGHCVRGKTPNNSKVLYFEDPYCKKLLLN